MEKFAAGTTVTLSLPFTDMSGGAVTPSAADLYIYDEAEALVATQMGLTIPSGQDHIEVEIPGASNQLPSGAQTALRSVELRMTTPAGAVSYTTSYLITDRIRLVLLKNSFQTYGEALLRAEEILDIPGWETSSDFDRQTALIEAFRRLTRLSFFIRWPVVENDMDRLIPADTRRLHQANWPCLTISDYTTYLPQTFRDALARAQVIEANEVLGAVLGLDKVSAKRRQGVISETIGESSMMFRMVKPIEEVQGVSRRALTELKGYLNYRTTITRV